MAVLTTRSSTCGAPVAWIVHGPHSPLNVNCPDRCMASTDIGYARRGHERHVAADTVLALALCLVGEYPSSR